MFTKTPALTSITINGKTFRYTRLWKIQGQSKTLYFCDYSQNVQFEGNTYSPAYGAESSAEASIEGLEISNRNILGVIDSNAITEGDLRSGEFDDAQVTEYQVDHRFPFAGAFRTQVFRVGKMQRNNRLNLWNADLFTTMGRLERSVGDNYGRTCPHDLGDNECGVNLSTYTSSTAISVIDTQRLAFQVNDTGQSSGRFEDGEVIFTSGSNTGYSEVVKTHTLSPESVVLQRPMPFDLTVGDNVLLVAGCNKKSGVNIDGTEDNTGHCKHRFSNLDNFGGYPFLPTDDAVLRTPDAKIEEDQ